MMKCLIFALLLGIINLSEGTYVLPITVTTPETVPYLAYIKSDLYCLGALINVKFVLVLAICIERRREARVYLGASTMPYYDVLGMGNPNMQKIDAAELITHPEYSKKIDTRVLQNNIGLIKLRNSAVITMNVRPIALPVREDFPLPAGMVLNVTGYMDSLFQSKRIRYMSVTVRPRDECRRLYGDSLQTDEQCTRADGERLDWPGPLVAKGVIVGLSRALETPIKCMAPTTLCSPQDVFLIVGPYINWITSVAGLPLGD